MAGDTYTGTRLGQLSRLKGGGCSPSSLGGQGKMDRSRKARPPAPRENENYIGSFSFEECLMIRRRYNKKDVRTVPEFRQGVLVGYYLFILKQATTVPA